MMYTSLNESLQGSNVSRVCLQNENTEQLTSDALMRTNGCSSRPPHLCSLHDDVSNATTMSMAKLSNSHVNFFNF